MRCLVYVFFVTGVLQTRVLVNALLRVDEEDKKKGSTSFKRVQREGNLALNCQAGLTKDFSGRILNHSARRSRRRPPILNNFEGIVEDSDTEEDPQADLARVEHSRGPVLLSSKRVGLPVMRDLVAATAHVMDPIDAEERDAAATHARTVVEERARAAAEAEAAKNGGRGSGRKAKKARKPGDESEEEEEEEEDIAGVPNQFLHGVFQHWAAKREQHGGPLVRCYQSFLMRRWTRMSDPVREVRAQRSVAFDIFLASLVCSFSFVE